MFKVIPANDKQSLKKDPVQETLPEKTRTSKGRS